MTGEQVDNATGHCTDDTERTTEEIDKKIEELRAFDDYPPGKRGSDKRREHGAWIKALRWVRGSDIVEEP